VLPFLSEKFSVPGIGGDESCAVYFATGKVPSIPCS
jgi:hypothetical protein